MKHPPVWDRYEQQRILETLEKLDVPKFCSLTIWVEISNEHRRPIPDDRSATDAIAKGFMDQRGISVRNLENTVNMIYVADSGLIRR